jgi:hypothetical protein
MAVPAVLERGVGTRNSEEDAQRATTESEPPLLRFTTLIVVANQA